MPIRDEADPRALMSALSALGHPLALPCVVAARSALVFRRWKTGDRLAPNAYGIAEPLASAEEVMPSVVLVPLLAFDAEGHRLGYGGGYYDRTLELLARASVSPSASPIRDRKCRCVPRREHDDPLDLRRHRKGHTPLLTRRKAPAGNARASCSRHSRATPASSRFSSRTARGARPIDQQRHDRKAEPRAKQERHPDNVKKCGRIHRMAHDRVRPRVDHDDGRALPGS